MWTSFGSLCWQQRDCLWLGSSAATPPPAVLQMNTTLRNLELNGNGIEYDGMTALAEALMGNDALRGLHMR